MALDLCGVAKCYFPTCSLNIVIYPSKYSRVICISIHVYESGNPRAFQHRYHTERLNIKFKGKESNSGESMATKSQKGNKILEKSMRTKMPRSSWEFQTLEN